MGNCEERARIAVRLRAAFSTWYELRDVPGKQSEARKAEMKVHHIQELSATPFRSMAITEIQIERLLQSRTGRISG
jgi:hypothetical protein